MAKERKSPPLKTANMKELTEFSKTFSKKIKALRRRPGLNGLRRFTPIIIQDPDNPDQVKICYEVIIKHSDGSFSVFCICDGAVSSGLCGGGIMV